MSPFRFRSHAALISVVACGTLFQATCVNPFSDLAIRQISNVVTDSIFFVLDNIFVHLST